MVNNSTAAVTFVINGASGSVAAGASRTLTFEPRATNAYQVLWLDPPCSSSGSGTLGITDGGAYRVTVVNAEGACGRQDSAGNPFDAPVLTTVGTWPSA